MAAAPLNPPTSSPPAQSPNAGLVAKSNALATIASFVALLVPCFWQSRIQAGDLSSHLYNAWLATEIKAGQLPGLWLAPQTNNILADVAFEQLLRRSGVYAAEHVVMTVAVLLFGAGVLAFVRVVSGAAVTAVAPVVAIYAYGWVFHTGLVNFYVATAIALLILAICWRASAVRYVVALSLAIIGWMAHPVPVLWAVGVLLYRWLTRRFPTWRTRMLLAAALFIVAVGATLMLRWPTFWFPWQLILITGADQAVVYGRAYVLVEILLLVVIARWMFQRSRASTDTPKQTSTLTKSSLGWGTRGIFDDRRIVFDLYLLTAVGIVALPSGILPPGYGHGLTFIADRLSVFAGVLLLAWVAPKRLRPADAVLLGVACGLFFTLIYRDNAAANRAEDKVMRAVAELPPGQRVVMGMVTPRTRLDPLVHVLDRACIGRCYSYANYEPSTRQFRVRARPGNGVVATDYGISFAMQKGDYAARPEDLPLWRVVECGDDYCVEQMRAGQRVRGP